MASAYAAVLQAAISELQSNAERAEVAAQQLIDALAAVAQRGGRVACYGVGREGLAMRGFAMRLFHAGLQACVVGEMTAQHVGPGDLLLASAGPGYFSTVDALARQAHRDGACVIMLTSQPSATVQLGDWCLVLQVPATCLPPADATGHSASSAGGPPLPALASPLLMGSSYELALQLVFDVCCVLLQRRLGLTEREMAARHTNLE